MQNYTSPPVKRSCPGCGWMDVRRSMPRGIFDYLVCKLRIVPYRCRTCGQRFYGRLQPQAEGEPLRS